MYISTDLECLSHKKSTQVSPSRFSQSSFQTISCMDRMFKYLLLLAVSFVFASCDAVDPNDSDFKLYYSVSGSVLDYVDDGSPYLKEDAPVVLDGDTSVSNEEGIYFFEKVLMGNHIISISLPNYEYFADTINILSDTVINLPLYGVKEDYFPIQVNTQKRFEYHSGSGGGLFWVSDSGEATWEIYSLIQQGDDLIYYVWETLIYVRKTQSGETFPPDTVITNFEFIEDRSHVITIQNSIWDGISFDRYLDPRRGDTIYFTLYRTHSVCKTYLKRNVGIVKLQEQDMVYLSGTTYELIEY